MGVPRVPIQLRILDSELHAVSVNDHVQNVTTALQTYGQRQTARTRTFCGYIFKSKSPSCGISDTNIRSDDGTSAGSGIYAREIIHALPYLPVIDETQLDLVETKDNFLERAFSLARWHQSFAGPKTVSRLMDFHTTHRLMLAAHNAGADEALSMMISGLHEPLTHEATYNYLELFQNYLKTPLTYEDHARILTELQQQLSSLISSDETAMLNTEIRKYRGNPEELVTALQFIKRLANNYKLNDLYRQTYISPTPAEIALRYSKQ